MGKAKSRSQPVNESVQLVPPGEQKEGAQAITLPGLEPAFSAYRDAIEALPHASDTDAAPRMLNTLLARGRLAEVMVQARPPFDGESLGRLVALDERLKSRSALLVDAVGRESFEAWREAFCPRAVDWWWFLDQRTEASHQESSLGWQILGAGLVAVAFSLSAEISQRFLSGGPDFFGVFSTLAQAFLAVLAGSSFTQFGGKWLERIFSRRSVRHSYRPLWKLGLALAVFVAVLVLRLSLPTISRLYNVRGVKLTTQGQLHGAIEHFQRAIALDPSSVEPHYNLAVAYEKLLDYEKAISEYELARLRGSFPELDNNLAHLYLRREDYKGAIDLLSQRMKPPSDPGFSYTFHKNRGWARLGLKLYHYAQRDLELALDLKEKPIAANCLLAQLHEAQKNEAVARTHWRRCLSNYGVDDSGQPLEPVEAEWLETARERVSEAKGGQP